MMIASRNEASMKFIEETTKLYASLLSHPPPEKQFARPTFKFIQNLVKSLIVDTRTLRDVFIPSDFDTEKKVWDKRMKTAFVQKLLDHTAKNGQPVAGCVAAKVVAGLEPNKTNELLQSLARLAQARLGGKDAPANRPRTYTRMMTGSGSVLQQQQTSTTRQNTAPKTATQSHRTAGGRASGAKERRSSSVSSAESGQLITQLIKDPPAMAQINIDLVDVAASEMSDDKPDERQQQLQSIANISNTIRQPRHEQRQQVVMVTNESDIGRHIPQLKSNLRLLRQTLSEFNQLDEQFKIIFSQTNTNGKTISELARL